MSDRLTELDQQQQGLMIELAKQKGRTNDHRVETALWKELTKVLLEKQGIYKQQLDNLKK